MLARYASLLAFSCIVPTAIGATPTSCAATSGPQTVAVLELYTSEGCNSCPPADRWISALPTAGFTADKLIPLAFHVDYWDYIGWKDRFASPIYTQRQTDMKRFARNFFIYTPQVIINGRDFRARGSNERLAEAAKSINQTPAQAHIHLRLEDLGKREWKVSADVFGIDVTRHHDAAVYLAIYENKLTSNVKAGENAGAILRHDYVVRQWIGPLALNDGKLMFTRSVTLSPDQNTGNSGLVLFAQNLRDGEVLQALQLPFC